MLWTMIALGAASPVVGMADDCSGLPDIEASAPNLAALPPEIVRDLEYIIGEMPGDVGSDLRIADLLDASGRHQHSTRMHSAVRIDQRWYITIEVAEMAFPTVFLARLNPDGSYETNPQWALRGPRCAVIEAMRRGVYSVVVR